MARHKSVEAKRLTELGRALNDWDDVLNGVLFFRNVTGVADSSDKAAMREIALMDEPSVAEVEQSARPARLERVPTRVSERARHVRVVDVREHNDEAERDAGDGSRKYKPYEYRFIVSGHWREQPCGPNRSERKRRWIAPYIKGPKSKPLMLKDMVRILRS